MENIVQTGAQKRNYQLDFLKLIFALLVFLVHTKPFIGENTRISLPPELGAVSVHFFFIISGMLMTNSIVRQKNIVNPGQSAISFVVKKYKSISRQFLAAFFLCLCVWLYSYTLSEGTLENIIKSVTRIFPELFLVNASGIWLFYNCPVWYLSSMLICMLPLAYLMYKKREFTIYVFAPLTAVLTFGYICLSNNWSFIEQSDLYGFIMGSIIRGICGLCCGICAWTIFNRIKNSNMNKNIRILLTFTEAFLYLTFFTVWFVIRNQVSIMSVVLILPIAIAVTFSGKSYISRLFEFKWMRYFGSLSLIIYLNHRTAAKLVETLFLGRSYKFCVAVMILLTAVFCTLNFLIVTLAKSLWSRKLKAVFIENKESDFSKAQIQECVYNGSEKEKSVSNSGISIPQRNYEIDFLKIIFAIFVLWTHTLYFKGENTKIVIPTELGQVSVHFFFIISGMLMVNSIVKHGDNILSPAKSAVTFVIRKYMSIGWKFVAALFICLSVWIYTYSYGENALSNSINSVTSLFPELFLVSSAGFWNFLNGPAWYLSAMLICMLPLAYLLYKNRDFTLHVFAPLTAVLTLGYMSKSNNWKIIDQRGLYGFLSGSMIMAMCGLCFGICAWTIYNRIKNANLGKNMRVLLTVTEAFLYSVFFSTWLILGNAASIKSVLLILPIAVAITFSGQSYICRLFRFKWMRYFGPLSLTVYLNHRAAARLVEVWCMGRSDVFCVTVMLLLTAVFCLLNLLIVTFGKMLWKNKLKTVFTKPDEI